MSRHAFLENCLQAAFKIAHLEVINESHNHRGGTGQETHFKCVIVSPDFIGKRAVQRHQAVYALMMDEMEKGLHALALHTYTPTEWAELKKAPDSPACQHKRQE